MTITKSPVSTCGVKTVFSLPRKRFAAFTATFPSTWSEASITHHLRGTSLALAENVFIFEKGHENYGRHKWMSTIEALRGCVICDTYVQSHPCRTQLQKLRSRHA